jgi:hypothetical protein
MFEPTAHGETAAMMVITRRPAADAVSNDSATEINATPPMVFIGHMLGRDSGEINEILRVLCEGCRLPFNYTGGMDVLNSAFAELGDSTQAAAARHHGKPEHGPRRAGESFRFAAQHQVTLLDQAHLRTGLGFLLFGLWGCYPAKLLFGLLQLSSEALDENIILCSHNESGS